MVRSREGELLGYLKYFMSVGMETCNYSVRCSIGGLLSLTQSVSSSKGWMVAFAV